MPRAKRSPVPAEETLHRIVIQRRPRRQVDSNTAPDECHQQTQPTVRDQFTSWPANWKLPQNEQSPTYCWQYRRNARRRPELEPGDSPHANVAARYKELSTAQAAAQKPRRWGWRVCWLRYAKIPMTTHVPSNANASAAFSPRLETPHSRTRSRPASRLLLMSAVACGLMTSDGNRSPRFCNHQKARNLPRKRRRVDSLAVPSQVFAKSLVFRTQWTKLAG